MRKHQNGLQRQITNQTTTYVFKYIYSYETLGVEDFITG